MTHTHKMWHCLEMDTKRSRGLAWKCTQFHTSYGCSINTLYPPPFFFFSLLRFAVELDSLFINEQQKKRERRHDVRDLANLAASTAMFSQLLNVDPYQTKPTID